MNVKIVKAKVGTKKVNCCLEPGFLGPPMCTDKILKKIGGKITKRITPEEKNDILLWGNSMHPLGWAVIPLTFTSNIKDNIRLGNDKSITIPTEVVVEKYNSKIPNFIMLGNDWFFTEDDENDSGSSANAHKIPTYLPEIVIDAEDGLVRTTLRIKDYENRGPRVIVSVAERNIEEFYKSSQKKRKNETDSSDSDLNLTSPPSSDSENWDLCTFAKQKCKCRHYKARRKVKLRQKFNSTHIYSI